MAKRRKHAEEHENLERWLVSYADFITLLFATFVVLYALSQLDLAKFKDLKVSLQMAFSGQTMVQGGDGVLEKNGDNVISQAGASESSAIPFFEYMQAMNEENNFKNTQKELEELQEKREIEGLDVRLDERGLVINLLDSLFYSSGSAGIKKSAYPTLKKVGDLLKGKYASYSIRVEGHTDNIPIKSDIHPSNWELSSARASSVIRFLIANFDFSKARFSALGYAETVPIANNDTQEGRTRNRRVEIVVLRNKFVKSEPLKPNKKQLEKITPEVKKPEKENKPQNKNSNNVGKVSEAAKKLMDQTGISINNVLIYQDAYDKESEKIIRELQQKEQKVSGATPLPEAKKIPENKIGH